LERLVLEIRHRAFVVRYEHEAGLMKSESRDTPPCTVQPMMSRFARLIVFVVVVLCASLAAGQNVIINGDFETGPFETNGTVSGWTVTNNVGDVSGEGFTSSSHAAAFSLGGDSQGNMLSQTFATVSGITYTLDFDAGVFGVRTGDPLSLQIQVFGSGMSTLLEETVIPPYNGNFNPASFNHYTYSFVADGIFATLTFTDFGTGNLNADVMLDTIAVIPEPVSSVLLMLGAAPLICLMLRKKTVR